MISAHRCWYYKEASGYKGNIKIKNANARDISFAIPGEIAKETTIHLVCEVKDNGSPQFTRYQRVIISVEPKN